MLHPLGLDVVDGDVEAGLVDLQRGHLAFDGRDLGEDAVDQLLELGVGGFSHGGRACADEGGMGGRRGGKQIGSEYQDDTAGPLFIELTWTAYR